MNEPQKANDNCHWPWSFNFDTFNKVMILSK